MKEKNIRKFILPAAGLLVLLLLPAVMPNQYYMHIVNTILITSMVAIGLNILTGYCGQISIGHAAFYGIGAYISAYLTTRMGFSYWIAIPVSGIMTAVIGYCIGAATLKLEGSYLAIASIGVGEITRLIFINWTEVTGGAEGFKKIPSPEFFGVVLKTDYQYYWLVLPIFIVIYIAYKALMESETGRAFLAVKQEETAAGFMGINTSRMKVRAFTISTLLAGIAGSLTAGMNNYLAPNTYNSTQSVSYLMMVLAGGMGTITGPLVGVTILTLAKEMFRAFNEYQMIIYGVLLVVVIIFMPRGIVGSLSHMLNGESSEKSPAGKLIAKIRRTGKHE